MDKRVKDELATLTDIIVRTIPVEQVFLFGSHAYGTPGPDSDLDIFVVMSEDAKIREIDAMRLLQRAIRDRKTMPVDIVVSSAGKFNRRKLTPTIERQIVQEGVVLYG